MPKKNAETIKFTNYTDEDFTHTWDGIEHTFEAGETVMMEDWKAWHFAYHLAQREMQKDDIQRVNNEELRRPYMKKILGSEPEAAQNEIPESETNEDIGNEMNPAESKVEDLDYTEKQKIASDFDDVQGSGVSNEELTEQLKEKEAQGQLDDDQFVGA